MQISSGFQYWVNSSFMVPGWATPATAGTLAASTCSADTVSSIERRSHRTTSAATPPIANGMRQPHSVRSPLGMTFCRITRTSSAIIWPPISVTYWKLEKNPRRLEVAASDM